MNWILEYAGWAGFTIFNVVGGFCGFRPQIMKPLSLALLLVLACFIGARRRRGQASDLDLGLVGYFALAALGFWLFPGFLGRIMSGYPVTTLYVVLVLVAAIPPLLGAAPFTTYYARKTAPEAVWETAPFKEINRHLTWFWVALFALNALVSLVPDLLPHLGWPWFFNYVLPTALFMGVGFPVNRWYPQYRQRRMGLRPASAAPVPEAANPGPAGLREVPREKKITATAKKEEGEVAARFKTVAVNGSPHEGFGNTSQMVAMLKEQLAKEDFDLEEIFLNKQHIEYCAGCGVCIEKGACWIRDDHKGVVQKLLEADAVILASPVYFRQVTAQMKTFLDRSLGYGHRPRGTWKPGLAVSVSAGWGETEVSQYLARMLGVYGAFPVGQLTAIGVGPGGFWGKEALEARAEDLARDLARAVKEKRLYPPTDQYLDYWHFMGSLIKENRDFMKADYEHWQKLGILESFEAYIGQSRTQGRRDPGMREAWLKELMERQRGRAVEAGPATEAQAAAANPGPPETVRGMMEAMPGALDREAAAGLRAIYQFEVSGAENFTACIRIDNGTAVFQEGPASQPDVIIRTPADVWLAVSKGELDGAAAFMTGKFQVEGDLGLLMKLKGLF
ncbi:MAG: hypothetical protein C4567_09855, partial [Deltaproteobacteria bacterium]